MLHARRVGLTPAIAVLVAFAMWVATALAQATVQPVNDAPNPYQAVEGWAKMPEGRTWGSTSAVEIDPDGKSIWVAERCGANSCAGSTLPVVLKFDASGNLVTSFGAGMFIFPHGIHVDRDGNVWVTDARAATTEELAKFPDAKGKGHVVVKFSPDGKVLMTLGQPGVAGDPPNALNEPCDVVTAPNGDIFVADGHSGQNANATPATVARIVKYSKDGKFIKAWGKWGSGPGEFKTPHGLAFDSRGRLFVADRGNVRLQIFDQEGTVLDEWKQFSRLSGIYIDRNDMLYGADSESNSRSNPGWKRGLRIGSARDGKVLFFIPDPVVDADKASTSGAEGVAADAAGNVYGAEVGPRMLRKYAKSPAGQDPSADFLKQGQAKLREGRHDEALALFRQALAAAPDSYQANSQAGVVLDLMGQYGEARKYLARVIEVASTDLDRTRALRSMAMSYAFERNCKGAAQYASRAYDIFLAAKDFFNSGEVANELARICLESGDLEAAQKWYQMGHDVGLREPDLKPERRDLWEFRWEHAQARLAARRGNATDARAHVATAKAILDKGTNPDQAPFFPYLAGYVAFYGGDYRTALAELQKANQNDPFILSLIAQTYEKLGDDAQAKAYYQKVLTSNAHNPTNAFARPLAKKKLGFAPVPFDHAPRVTGVSPWPSTSPSSSAPSSWY